MRMKLFGSRKGRRANSASMMRFYFIVNNKIVERHSCSMKTLLGANLADEALSKLVHAKQ